MISRYLVIALAFVAAALQASRGALIEASGLVGLGAGLVFLKLGTGRPQLKVLAYAAFGVTVLAMIVALIRMRQQGAL